MDSVIRGLAVYLFLFLIFRFSGQRTLSQTTNFDLVVLLIISETTQQAMVNGDHSITNAFLLIVTLVGMSIIFSFLKRWSPSMEKWIDGFPLVLVEKGRIHEERLKKVRVDKDDILEAARSHQGLENMEEIKYAILERSGEITIIPLRNK